MFSLNRLCIFAALAIWPAAAQAAGFTPPTLWIEDFAHGAGAWRMERHVRVLADVNGDGLQDIVGFDDDGVKVSLSTGGRFLAPALWIADFGHDAGQWRVDRHIRTMVDVDGDGLDDIVGFGDAGTYVARSTGLGFRPSELWVSNYGYDAGEWRIEQHVRGLADVDGDDLPDVVGFGDYGVYVSRSTGSSFTPPDLWVEGYARYVGYWNIDRNPRTLGDVDGDGRHDVVGFGNEGVYVSLSTGAGFTPPDLWIDAYGQYAGDWRAYKNPRAVADVDGDGRHDIVGFSDLGVLVSLSQGTSFRPPRLWVAQFGREAGNWRLDRHPRALADVDGDGLPDIVGFGDRGVFVSVAAPGSYTWPQHWVTGFGYREGWRVDKHLRLMGDVNGDGLADIVGFHEDGVFVSLAEI